MNKRASALYVSVFTAAVLPIAAECIVENPGGSKVNVNRPSDAAVSPGNISPLSSG